MTVVGSAEVIIEPLTAAFGPKTEAAVKKALAGVNANIEIHADLGGLRERIEATLAGLTAEVELDVDLLGIRQRVELALSGIRADVDLDLDLLAARTRIEAGLAGIEVKVKTNIDRDTLTRSAGDAGEAASQALAARLERVKSHLGRLDSKAIRSSIEQSMREIGRIRSEVDIDLDANVDKDRFQRSIEKSVSGAIPGGGGIRTLLAGLALPSLDASVGGLAALTGGLLAAANAGISAASAIGSTAAAALTLPSAALAGAQGILVLTSALSGVGGALKAYTAQQKAAGVASAGGGASAASQERAIRSAERAIARANRGITEAYEDAAFSAENSARRQAEAAVNLADAVEEAARRVKDAQDRLRSAQDAAGQAQEDLTKTRARAREELDELRRSVERLALSEQQARARLSELQAKKSLADKRAAQDLTGATESTIRALERQAQFEDQAAENPRLKANLDMQDAELELAEIIAKRATEQERLNHINEVGVEGTDEVVAARRRLANAEDDLAKAYEDTGRAAKASARQVIEAQQSVRDAARDAERARVQSARRIIDAEDSVTAATEAMAAAAEQGMGAAAGAVDRYQAALDDLAPAQRRFVEFLVSLRPLIREFRDEASAELLPGVETSIRRALPLLEDFRPVLRDTARALSDISLEAANLVSSPAWRTDLVRLGQGNVDVLRSLAAAGLSAAGVSKTLLVTVQPLTERLADMGARIFELANKTAEAKRETGELDAFFGRVGDRIEKLVITSGFLGSALLGVFKQATPAGDGYLSTLERMAARLDLVVEKANRSGTLRKFFEDSKPAAAELGGLLGDIVTTLLNIGSSNFDTFIGASQAVRTDLLPALQDLFSEVGGGVEAIIHLATKGVELFDVFVAGNPVIEFFTDTLSQTLEMVRFLSEDIPVLSPLVVGLVGGMIALRSVVSLINLVKFATGFQALQSTLVEMGNVKADRIAEGLGRVGAALQTLGTITLVAGAWKVAFDKINQSLEDHIDRIIKSQRPLAAYESSLKDINKVFPELAGNQKVSAALFGDIATKSASAAQRIIDDMRKQGKATGSYQAILDRVIDDLARQGITEDDVTRKVQDATDKLRGKNAELDRYLTRLRDTTDHLLAQSNAELASRDAIDRLTRAIQENGGSFDINTEKGRINLRLRNDLIGAISTEVGQLEQAATKGQLDVEAKDRLIGRLQELAHSAYPEVAGQAQGFIDRLNHLVQNSPWIAEFHLNTQQAEDALRLFGANFATTARAIKADTGNILANIEGRASGGRILARTAYIVGEKGPELFVSDQPGTIVPKVTRPDGIDFTAPGLPEGPTVPTVTAPGVTTASWAVTTVNYNAPLLNVDQSFGPGSNASDLIEAMRDVARHEVTTVIEAAIDRLRAGVGQRGGG